MSRTGIYLIAQRSSVTVAKPTGHIELNDPDSNGVVVVGPGDGRQLVASIGDPSTGKSNTGHICVINNDTPYTIFLRKETGHQLEWLSVDPESAVEGNSPQITFTNDWPKGSGTEMEETSITIHVKGYFHSDGE